ncbi:MAG: hypothetical protein ABIH57_02575 [Candidatus Omnitrophota bacterium]
MTIQHKNLAEGRWGEMSFCVQMANIGSEVNRALNWRNRGKADFSKRAIARALELIDLTLDSLKVFSRIREVARLREAICDDFYGLNRFSSTDTLWRKYFDHFNYAARLNHPQY